jgi:hypothetical protein
MTPGTNLYVGGQFTTAGGNTADYIAKWNGSAWSSVGGGMDNYVYSLAVDPNYNVYAGGAFTNAGGVYASRIAEWNGSTWSPLGSGVNNIVLSLAADSAGRLYAGGLLTVAGTNVSAYVAQANVLNLISGQKYTTNGNYSFNFLTTPNSTNRVFAATNLLSGLWQPIYTNVAPANGLLQFTDTNTASFATKFYRVSTP